MKNKRRVKKPYKTPEEKRKRALEYYYANKERVLARQKAYNEEHPKRKKEWYARTSEERKAASREYRSDNPEAFAERGRNWRRANPDKVKASCNRWYEKVGKQTNTERCKEYRRTHSEAVKKANRMRMRQYSKTEKYKAYMKAYRERKKLEKHLIHNHIDH